MKSGIQSSSEIKESSVFGEVVRIDDDSSKQSGINRAMQGDDDMPRIQRTFQGAAAPILKKKSLSEQQVFTSPIKQTQPPKRDDLRDTILTPQYNDDFMDRMWGNKSNETENSLFDNPMIEKSPKKPVQIPYYPAPRPVSIWLSKTLWKCEKLRLAEFQVDGQKNRAIRIDMKREGDQYYYHPSILLTNISSFKYCRGLREIYLKVSKVEGVDPSIFDPSLNPDVVVKFENPAGDFQCIIDKMFKLEEYFEKMIESVEDNNPNRSSLMTSPGFQRTIVPKQHQTTLLPSNDKRSSDPRSAMKRKEMFAMDQTKQSKSRAISNKKEDDEKEYVVLDDDIDFQPKEKERPVRKPKPIKEDKFLFNFGGIRVSTGDVDRCEDGEFLNDVIIDFYIEHLLQINPEWRSKYMLFNTQFYPLLNRGAETLQRTAERNPKKKVKIFEKEVLFIPINEKAHWTLIVLLNLNNVNKEVDEKQQPLMCLFDSLGGRGVAVMNKVREYLVRRYFVETGIQLTKPKGFFRGKYPHLPIQPNSYDCGVYMLHYIELFAQQSRSFEELDSLKTWFEISDIPTKRNRLRDLIMAKYDSAPSEDKIDHLINLNNDESSQPEFVAEPVPQPQPDPLVEPPKDSLE